MFDLKYEDRLQAWSRLRQELETSLDPFQHVSDFYNRAPRVSIATDPWDKTCWPNPWELVFENQYDDFLTVLGQCYSLQLTDRFKDSSFEIHIGIDNKESRTCYLLIIDNSTVIGWNDSYVNIDALPKSLVSQTIHSMTPIQ
jgi:hypothetical protein